MYLVPGIYVHGIWLLPFRLYRAVKGHLVIFMQAIAIIPSIFDIVSPPGIANGEPVSSYSLTIEALVQKS